MKLLCIDLEATCDNQKNGPQDHEIIEIGYCLVDCYTRSILFSGNKYVLPNQLPLSNFCTNLTGITDDKLKQEGTSLKESCLQFHAMIKAAHDVDTKELPWMSFGEWDKTQFEHECLQKGAEYPLSFKHYNLKDVLNNCFKDLIHLSVTKTKTFGLHDASRLFGLKFEGRHHSGIADAKMVGRLALHLIGMMDLNVMKNLD